MSKIRGGIFVDIASESMCKTVETWEKEFFLWRLIRFQEPFLSRPCVNKNAEKRETPPAYMNFLQLTRVNINIFRRR